MLRSLDGPGSTAVLALVVAVTLVLVVLFVGVAGAQEADLHPWWETSTMVALLVTPYLVAIRGLAEQRSPTARGLMLIVAGVGSLVPAVFTLTVFIGLGLGVLAIVLVAMGVSTITPSSARLSALGAAAALGAIVLLLAAPFARFATDDARCVRVMRDAHGVETRETYTPAYESGGHLRVTSPSGTVRESCTSGYVTGVEAAASTALSVAGGLLAVFGTRPGERRAERDRSTRRDAP